MSEALLGGLVLALCGLVLLALVGHSLANSITPMPSSARAVTALLAVLAEIRPPARVAELGSGWGGVARRLAAELPGATVVAYETSPVPLLFSRLRPRPNLRLRRRDFLAAELGGYDLLYCYLCPELMTRLTPKLERELKAGAIVVSNTFGVRGWQPSRVIEQGDIWGSRLYVYVRGVAGFAVGGS